MRERIGFVEAGDFFEATKRKRGLARPAARGHAPHRTPENPASLVPRAHLVAISLSFFVILRYRSAVLGVSSACRVGVVEAC